MGLNDDMYSSIRSQILKLNAFLSLDRIFNMIVQEENHKNMMLRRESRIEFAVAFIAMTGDRPYGTVTEKVGCKHCENTGITRVLAIRYSATH